MEPDQNPNLRYEKIGKHLSLSQYGASITMNEEGIGAPIYRMNEIHNMMCDLNIAKFADLDEKELKQLTLAPRDVLFNRTNSYEWVGRTGLFLGHEGSDAVFASYLVRFRTKHDTLLPEYLVAFLNCKYGVADVKRRSRQSINQTNVNPEEVKEIAIPLLSMSIQEEIKLRFEQAFEGQKGASLALQKAEAALLSALGLAGWTPPEPLSYTARAADALSAARLDAQFYAPRIRALLDLLGRDGRTLADIAKPRRERFNAKKCDTFHYIEIGDVEGGGGLGASLLDAADAPSRATWHVRSGDVLTSTVRPIRRLSAIVAPDQDRYVASSGFAVLQPTGVTPEVLMTFLRLPAICELMDLYASASMYPAISEADILGLPIPAFSAELSAAVTESVQSAFAARARSRALLSSAKRAVEIAIEDGEAAALGFLSPG